MFCHDPHPELPNMPLTPAHLLRGARIMGDAVEIMQLADAGATALVAGMVKSTWETVRDATARFFQRGGGDVVEPELRLIDAARARLIETAESERASVEEKLRSELMIQLAAFLQKCPAAAGELQELVDKAQGPEAGSGARMSADHNTNSQVVISGGGINASGGINYRAPEAGR